MPEYAVAASVAVVATVLYELLRARTGVFTDRRYQLAMAICLGFMFLVNGWLTKLTAPIVLYDGEAKTPWRFPWDIPVEDYLFGFALLTLVVIRWKQAAVREREAAAERDASTGRRGSPRATGGHDRRGVPDGGVAR
jgi:lycopene cyclase domain-containing protein